MSVPAPAPRSTDTYRRLNPDGIIERSYLNVAGNNTSGIALQVTFRGKKFSFNLNNTLRYIDFNSEMNSNDQEGLVANSGGNASFKATPTLTVRGIFFPIQNGSTSGARQAAPATMC